MLRKTPHILSGLGIVLALATPLVVPAPAGAQAADEQKKFRREILMMENVINDILVESRNVLVPSREAAHGHYLPEFGLLFTTEASLLSRYGRGWDWANWNVDDSGDRIVISRDKDDDGDLDEKRSVREEKQYRKFKEEMVEALMEGGDRITRLRDDQWVGISVALEDSEYFRKNKLRNLMVKARVSDLKAYGDGRLTEAQFQAKVVTEES